MAGKNFSGKTSTQVISILLPMSAKVIQNVYQYCDNGLVFLYILPISKYILFKLILVVVNSLQPVYLLFVSLKMANLV